MAEEERKWPVVLGVGALVAVPPVILPEPQVIVEFPALKVYPGPLPPLPKIVPPIPTPQRPIGEQVSVDFPQQQVALGGIIRANKTWRNTGAAGTRDIYVAYGTGETPETFDMEFGGIRLDQYCAAGAQVTSPVDTQVPADAPLGLKNALVGVGKYDPSIGSMTFDDYEIVSDAIEVTPAVTPPSGAIFEIQNFQCVPTQACAVSWGEPIKEYVNVLFDIVNVGDETGIVYEVMVATSGWDAWWRYDETVAPGGKLHIDFYLGVHYACWHDVSVYADYDGDGVQAPGDKVYEKLNAFEGIECL